MVWLHPPSELLDPCLAVGVQGVGAGSADTDVCSAVSPKLVVPSASQDAVVPVAPSDLVHAGAAQDELVRGPTLEVACANDECRERDPRAGLRSLGPML